MDYRFQNRDLLEEAMRHSSYTNEVKRIRLQCNEKMEFLGDAVLQLISSDYLYKSYPSKSEGELSTLRASLVCEPSLAHSAKALRLGEFLLLGKGELMTGGTERNSILADAMESVIGAVYLDGGMEPANRLVRKHVLNDIATRQLFKDSKSKLQIFSQERFQVEPVYELVDESGPAHDKVFSVSASINHVIYGTGVGKSKKAAEQQAAFYALQRLGEEDEGCI
ncbi:MAG: ribonuclease III [Lachnospiraceae bacterium]|nr:ribonuclease III [Lachnospiraceae bacterium]